MTIESYTVTKQTMCKQCTGIYPLEKVGKLFQIVLDDGSGVDGPFCSEKCVKDYQQEKRRTTGKIKFQRAAEDLLAACEEAESEARNQLVRLKLCGHTDGPEYESWKTKQERWAAAIARAKS